jgi:hypothetical protein
MLKFCNKPDVDIKKQNRNCFVNKTQNNCGLFKNNYFTINYFTWADALIIYPPL